MPPSCPRLTGMRALRLVGVRGGFAWLGAGRGACLASLVFVPSLLLLLLEVLVAAEGAPGGGDALTD